MSLKNRKFIFTYRLNGHLQLLSEQHMQAGIFWTTVCVAWRVPPTPAVSCLLFPMCKSVSSDAVGAIKSGYSPSHHSSVGVRASSSFSDSDLSFMLVSCSCLKENYAAYRMRGKNCSLNIPFENCQSLVPCRQ